MALARTATHLRQCGAPRGDDRRRRRAGRPDLRQRGLDLLEWLLELRNGRRPPLAHSRRRAGARRTAGPPSISSRSRWRRLADACARAATADPRPIWPDGISSAAAWFQGANDSGLLMWDPETGGGFDGLHADRREPQPGRGVDPGRDLDFAARAALLACPAMTFDPNRARHAQPAAARGRPVTRDHAAVRARPGGIRAPGVPRGSGARRASSP